jgi:ParB/RepB/Spo0J family partition protein
MAKQTLFEKIQADKPALSQRKLKLSDIVRPVLPPPPDSDQDFRLLCESIEENGVVEPIVVRPFKDKFAIMDGTRRFYAAERAGIAHVHVVVATFGVVAKAGVMTIALNRRRSPNLLAEALAIQTLRRRLERDGYEGTLTQNICGLTGLKPAEIARRERLLTLDPDLREVLREGGMPSRVAERAAHLAPARQAALYKSYQSRKAELGEKARITHEDIHAVRTIQQQAALSGLPDEIFNVPALKPAQTNGHGPTGHVPASQINLRLLEACRAALKLRSLECTILTKGLDSPELRLVKKEAAEIERQLRHVIAEAEQGTGQVETRTQQ